MRKESIFNSLKDLNKMVHEPARTAILILLSSVEEADFLYVKQNTGLTQGNLSSHLSKLEEHKLINIKKTFRGKRPSTILSISEKGNSELTNYVSSMKYIFRNI